MRYQYFEQPIFCFRETYDGPDSEAYNIPPSLISVGQICAAIFPEDGNWHRVTITGIRDRDFVDVSLWFCLRAELKMLLAEMQPVRYLGWGVKKVKGVGIRGVMVKMTVIDRETMTFSGVLCRLWRCLFSTKREHQTSEVGGKYRIKFAWSVSRCILFGSWLNSSAGLGIVFSCNQEPFPEAASNGYSSTVGKHPSCRWGESLCHMPCLQMCSVSGKK